MVKEQNNWKKQRNFSEEEIQERLKGFTKMSSIYDLKPGMQVRYISNNKDNTRSLKMGGILTYVDNENKKYIKVKSMISSNINTFSVQLHKDTVIYFKQKDFVSNEIQESLRIAGSEKKLLELVKICGSSEDEIERNVKYIEKKYGSLLNMIVTLREFKKENKKGSKKKGSSKKKKVTGGGGDSDMSSFL